MQNVRPDTVETEESQGREPRRVRGRPRAFDRDGALLAATRLFWRKGYAATSIADLTEAMGIGSPSLYAAFGSKEALYAEAVRHYGALRGPRVWDRFERAPTARQAVEALLMDSAAALTSPSEYGDPPGCMVTLSAVGSEGCSELGTLVRGLRAEALAAIEARVARAVTKGELPGSVDLSGVARFVLAIQAGMSIQARDGATRSELEAAARVAMAGWNGIVAG